MHTFYFYSAKSSPRLEYVLSYIFEDRFLSSFVWKNEPIMESLGLNICYGFESKSGYSIPDIGLLWQEGIGLLEMKYEPSFNHFLFCKDGYNAPADILSSIFFMLSRYEEYDDSKDAHDRSMAKNSVAFQHDFLEVPVVDIWIQYLRNALEKFFNIRIAANDSYEFLPTFDIDQVYLMKAKSTWRRLGTIAKSMLNFDFRYLKISKNNDPFDVYDWIINFHKKNNLQPIFFFLLGNYHRFNPNHHHKNSGLNDVIKKIQKLYRIGIHPSYFTMGNEGILIEEIKRLENIINEPVRISRQHFLRFKLPITYQYLIAQNIRMDYSMGYADAVGFRAGTCRPFYWYDIENECVTKLLLQPFVAMDVTLKNYMHLKPTEAILKMKELLNICKQYESPCAVLWHNSSLSEFDDWKGWRQVYVETLNFNNTIKP